MDDVEQLIGAVPKNASEEVRVSISEFRGQPYINVRLYADLGEGERRPTKKGVTLRLDRLGALVDLLRQAEAEAGRRGLIGGDA